MDVSFDLLAGLVGQDLKITAADGVTVTARIAAAEPAPGSAVGGSVGGSVELSAPRAPALRQGTYPVRHDAHGSGLLFIVPVAEDETTRTYEAVFG